MKIRHRGALPAAVAALVDELAEAADLRGAGVGRNVGAVAG
jgi:hypothetical protein